MPTTGIVVGDNWLAIAAAAVAFYAVGFIIYGAVFSKLWMQLSGFTKEQLAPHTWKMAVSPIMPILTAIGLAIILKLAHVDNLATGLVVTFQIWFFIVRRRGQQRPGPGLQGRLHGERVRRRRPGPRRGV